MLNDNAPPGTFATSGASRTVNQSLHTPPLPVYRLKSNQSGTALHFTSNLAKGSSSAVKMELSGAGMGTGLDDKAPYALSGDASGDYNNRSAEKGAYTLKAASYAGTKSKAGAANGATQVVKFTIVK